MTEKTPAIKLAEAFLKYRRLQKKRAKLMAKKPDPKNVKPMEKILKDILHTLNSMDGMAAEVLAPDQEL